MDSTHGEEQKVGDGTSVVPEMVSETIDVVAPIETTETVLAWHKNKKVLASLIIAIALLAGAGWYGYTMNTTSGTVAVVNGKKIFQNEFDESRALIEQTATSQGADLADASVQAEVNKQALEILINNALLITAAEKAGFTAEASEVDAKYSELVAQLGGEEGLETKMKEIGLTAEKLKRNIKERILADKYIESETTIKTLTVSDEEVAEFLASISADVKDLPPLEEIRPQIEADILGQKQQEVVSELLAKLKAESEIKVNI
jgi:hypothetical protein